MKREIDAIISTNKNLLVIEKLIDEIFSQKGKFKTKIIIMHQYKKNYHKPKFLLNKNIIYRNLDIQNLSNAKNEGIKLSKANLITIIDDDVQIKNDYFLSSWKFINKNKCDLMFCKIYKFKSKIPFSKNMKSYDHEVSYHNSSGCLASSMWINNKNKKKVFFDKNIGLGGQFGSGDETDYIFSSLGLKRKVYYNSKVSLYAPQEFIGLNTFSQIYKKFISYGKGQGAVYKKHINKNRSLFILLFFSSLGKSLIAIIIYTFLLSFKNIIKHTSLFCGKFLGFYKYKS